MQITLIPNTIASLNNNYTAPNAGHFRAIKNLLIIILFLTIIGCSCSGSKPEVTHGTDIMKIDGFLNFDQYKPEQVEYELSKTGDGRLGPSDYTLEAMLDFDAATFAKLRSEYSSMDYPTQNSQLSTFDFKWLPKKLKEEIKQTDVSNIAPGSIFTTNPNCSILFLNNKVLVYYWTN